MDEVIGRRRLLLIAAWLLTLTATSAGCKHLQQRKPGEEGGGAGDGGMGGDGGY